MENANCRTTVELSDVALHDGVGWWIRVNGGDWNNDPTADPATDVGGLSVEGLTALYPAGCPGGWTGPGGRCLLIQRSAYVPSGYTFI